MPKISISRHRPFLNTPDNRPSIVFWTDHYKFEFIFISRFPFQAERTKGNGFLVIVDLEQAVGGPAAEHRKRSELRFLFGFNAFDFSLQHIRENGFLEFYFLFDNICWFISAIWKFIECL